MGHGVGTAIFDDAQIAALSGRGGMKFGRLRSSAATAREPP